VFCTGSLLILSVSTVISLNQSYKVTASDGTYPAKVAVSWNVVPNADIYKVYRAESPTGTKTLIGSRTGTSLDDTTGLVDVTYYYFVKSCYLGACGDNSAYDTGWG
jgi:fibronectin type 3 domain-containing protein